jgi:hypothetical protein
MAAGQRGCLVERHQRVRWYNPAIEDFEWREIPKSDEEALSLLEGSPYTSTCKQTYREWRTLGATIVTALIRAGEVGRAQGK